MAYIGNTPANIFTSLETQTITGDGSTEYTLTHAVSSGKDILVYINNVKQEEGSGKSYTATGSTITFSDAVASTDSCYLLYVNRAIATHTPADASVDADAIAGKFYTIAMAINAMRSSIENLSAGSMAKLMLLKAIGVTPGAAQPAEAGGGTRVTPPTPQTPQQDGFDLAMRRIGSTPISADTVPTTNMVGPEIPAQANQTQPAQPGMMDQFKDGVKQVGEETMDAKDILLAEIRDLQRENNRLLKKETKAISELDI